MMLSPTALKARRENTALRDHIERIKNEEVGMGLEASKRMAELSAEYMSQVDKLKKEKETARERAEAEVCTTEASPRA